MRILALDVGEKTCGFALSDPLQITAQGKENFFFPRRNWNVLIEHIQKYVREFEIEKIVIGYPTYPSGDKSSTTVMIENFQKMLVKVVSQKVVFASENWSTKQAVSALVKVNMSRSKRKKHKDKLSAQIILQNFLQENTK